MAPGEKYTDQAAPSFELSAKLDKEKKNKAKNKAASDKKNAASKTNSKAKTESKKVEKKNKSEIELTLVNNCGSGCLFAKL